MTDLSEPPLAYQPDRRKGTWQAPAIPPDDVRRIRNASHLARTVLPPALADLVARDLVDWCEHGRHFGDHGRKLRQAAELEAMHRDMTLGRTYG